MVKIDYGTWKDGSSIFKNKTGYYIVQYNNNTQKEYKKYLKNYKPPKNAELLYLDKKTKKWTSVKTKKKTKK
jgi:hypothetical protein